MLDIGDLVRPNQELITKLKELSTPTVLESLKGKFNMNSEIKPFWPGAKAVGVALTVRCQVGDNLTLHKAIEISQPGDLLVVDAGGYKETGGMFGEIMALTARKRGVVGLVIDGAVRDIPILRELNFPVFARNTSPGSTVKKSFGSINRPITCGGILVNPGDLIIADEDGVVVIPAARAEEVIKAGQERDQKEIQIKKLIEQGKSTVEIYGFDKILNNM
ncbi:MAG TPA: 4-carboxy-4-hydroxy-2-oxoadipate aldolase/oxaloacetate decarboxylase [Bacillota bacterium]